LVAALSAWLAFREVRWFMPPAYSAATRIHRQLFGKLIQLGWVQR